MLVRADPTNNTLSMLSFPRDLVVPIYCNGSDVPRVTDRINSAWSTCGAEGTLDTVQHLTGLPVNYLITIDFHGFKLLVNKLHGVYIQVDRRYLNTQGGPGGFAKIDLEPGYQKLDGEQALDYVRYRHTDSDLYRTARQQLFIEALKDRFASGFSLLQAPAIIGSMKHSIEIGRAGGGSPSMDEILSYAGLAYHLQAGHLFRNSLNRNELQPYGPFNAELIAPPSTIAAAVDVVRASGRDAADARERDGARHEAQAEAGGEAPAVPGVDARAQRDDDRRLRARHVVQDRAARLPRVGAAAADQRGRPVPRLHDDADLLRPGSGRLTGGRAAARRAVRAGREDRRADAGDRAVRAGGGQSPDRRHRRHRLHREPHRPDAARARSGAPGRPRSRRTRA